MESPKNLKRSREEAMDVDEHEEKLSKSQKKKLAKKLKAEDGKAAPAPVPAPALEKKVEEKTEEKKGKKDKKDKKDRAEKKEKSEQKSGEKKEKGDKKVERTLDGGVKVRDFKVGTGKMAKKGDKVEMRYIGKLPDDKVFDKNTKGKPVGYNCCVLRITHNSMSSSSSRSGKVMSSRVGQIAWYARCDALTVVSGWDIGVAGMQIGGEREIVVPSSMGYGSKKVSGIPPNSTLKFGASQSMIRQTM